MSIETGELRHRVIIQSLAETPNTDVGITPTYMDVATLWAKFEPFKGVHYFETKEITADISAKVTIRYYPEYSITAENWLVHDGIRYRIRSVRDIEKRKVFLELMLEEVERINA